MAIQPNEQVSTRLPEEQCSRVVRIAPALCTHLENNCARNEYEGQAGRVLGVVPSRGDIWRRGVRMLFVENQIIVGIGLSDRIGGGSGPERRLAINHLKSMIYGGEWRRRESNPKERVFLSW